MTQDTLRQKAYRFIQTKLLEGELRAGDLVSEQTLAAEVGMSRTPVREAITQLQLEGLFDKVPRVGTIVRAPSSHELSELYEVRQGLESYAAAHAARHLALDDLATLDILHRELQDIVAQMEQHGLQVLDEELLHRFLNADISFHMLIVRATHNRRSLQIISEFRVIQRVFEYDRVKHNLSLVKTAATQHGEVLSALRNVEGEAARLAMYRHIQTSRDYALDAFTTDVSARDTLLALPADLMEHIAGLEAAEPPRLRIKG